jgi:cold shock CspA family protein
MGVERRRTQLVTGRILQFDHTRGYGFVAADDGGEDVFLHASVFDGDPDELVPGTKMGFKVMARCPKATIVGGSAGQRIGSGCPGQGASARR